MTELERISIEVASGIGPARKKLLEKLGISSVADALRYYPRAYSDRRSVTEISGVQGESSALVVGKVTSVSLRRYSWKNSLLTVKVSDGTGEVSALWFNQAYLRGRFARGKGVVLFGKVDVGPGGERRMANPDLETLPLKRKPSPHLFRIVPVYSATENLAQRTVRNAIFSVVGRYSHRVREFLPSEIRRRLQLVSLPEAIKSIHFPEDWPAVENAKRRLTFQECFLFQMGAALKRKFLRTVTKKRRCVSSQMEGPAERFLRGLPFQLTAAQIRAIEEIGADLSSPQPMSRLLHGDVGCGKTVVAVWAILHSIASGCQACIMAPTELLARQHYWEISRLLQSEDCTVSLLVGSAGSKEILYDDIRKGRTDLVIGTQALVQEDVRFKRLGLVVIDEQHRFGVLQRLKLYEKGQVPDVLVLSATPIPRTLCQTLYGDMDVSVIDEMPPGRSPVQTRCLPSCRRADAYASLQKIVCAGDRAYVVCPTIEEKEESERISVLETHRHLARDVFPEMRIGFLYGSMEPGEKEKTIGEFRNGRLDILVTTTVVEIGIDVPDAGAMLIMNGECFGLAQLHQMRGRVGRGRKQGYCIVVADPKTDAAKQRLEILERSNDGFQIAVEDLKLRGAGEFFGTRQHGLSEVGLGNLLEDYNTMQLARKEAFRVANGEVSLPPEEGEALMEELTRTYGDSLRLSLV